MKPRVLKPRARSFEIECGAQFCYGFDTVAARVFRSVSSGLSAWYGGRTLAAPVAY